MRKRTFTFFLCLISTWCFLSVAHGQLAKLVEPPITRSELSGIIDRLELSPEQKHAAEQLFDGYMARYVTDSDGFKKAYAARENAAKAGIGIAAADLVFKTELAGFSRRKDTAERELLSDLRLVLTQEQADVRWPGVERLVRRKLMARIWGRTSTQWNKVDLVAVVGHQDLPPDALRALAAVLTEYEVEVDRHLHRYQQMLWSKSLSYFNPQDNDFERVGSEVAAAVALINKKYVKIIEGALPPDRRQQFIASAQEQAYWYVTSLSQEGSRAGKLLRNARALPDLLQEQQESLARVEARWRDKLIQFRSAGMRAQDQADEAMAAISDIEWPKRAATDGNPGVRAQRMIYGLYHEIEQELVTELSEVLTPEQLDKARPANR